MWNELIQFFLLLRPLRGGTGGEREGMEREVAGVVGIGETGF